MSTDLFSPEKLAHSALGEVNLIREWLNRIEKEISDKNCVEAGVLIYLAESFTKLSYIVGMVNKSRLGER